MEKFSENIFMIDNSVLKPMNCPAHINIFNSQIVSYRDLPLRMAEFGRVFRNENSGSLNGLLRLKSFVQDDAHIFCSEEQIADEIKSFCKLVFEVYKKFGFEDVEIAFSDRPEKRIGSDEVWNLAENSIKSVLKDLNLEYSVNKGEGAFYGPKIEFVLKDNLNRKWQCGVIQIDFSMAKRLDAVYIDKDNSKKHPIILHRAILGSIERFIAILLENYQGKLPYWLSPVQVDVCSINDKVNDYCLEVYNYLKRNNIRVKLNIESERINDKIFNAYANKIPYAIVIGNKEESERKVMLKDFI
jgi:threonyl-tRNA synthetase